MHHRRAERHVPVGDGSGAEVVMVHVEGTLGHDRKAARFHLDGDADDAGPHPAVGGRPAQLARRVGAQVALEHDDRRPADGRQCQRLHRVRANVGGVVQVNDDLGAVGVLQRQEFAVER